MSGDTDRAELVERIDTLLGYYVEGVYDKAPVHGLERMVECLRDCRDALRRAPQEEHGCG